MKKTLILGVSALLPSIFAIIRREGAHMCIIRPSSDDKNVFISSREGKILVKERNPEKEQLVDLDEVGFMISRIPNSPSTQEGQEIEKYNVKGKTSGFLSANLQNSSIYISPPAQNGPAQEWHIIYLSEPNMYMFQTMLNRQMCASRITYNVMQDENPNAQAFLKLYRNDKLKLKQCDTSSKQQQFEVEVLVEKEPEQMLPMSARGQLGKDAQNIDEMKGLLYTILDNMNYLYKWAAGHTRKEQNAPEFISVPNGPSAAGPFSPSAPAPQRDQAPVYPAFSAVQVSSAPGISVPAPPPVQIHNAPSPAPYIAPPPVIPPSIVQPNVPPFTPPTVNQIAPPPPTGHPVVRLPPTVHPPATFHNVAPIQEMQVVGGYGASHPAPGGGFIAEMGPHPVQMGPQVQNIPQQMRGMQYVQGPPAPYQPAEIGGVDLEGLIDKTRGLFGQFNERLSSKRGGRMGSERPEAFDEGRGQMRGPQIPEFRPYGKNAQYEYQRNERDYRQEPEESRDYGRDYGREYGRDYGVGRPGEPSRYR